MEETCQHRRDSFHVQYVSFHAILRITQVRSNIAQFSAHSQAQCLRLALSK